MRAVELKKVFIKPFVKIFTALSALFYTGLALADNTPQVTMTFSDLQNNLSSSAGHIWEIISVILTLAGILLVAAGLVSLKQHHTGTGQEKHLTKGIAKLGFGAALFCVVPFTHMLVGGVGGTQVNSFSVMGGGINASIIGS